MRTLSWFLHGAAHMCTHVGHYLVPHKSTHAHLVFIIYVMYMHACICTICMRMGMYICAYICLYVHFCMCMYMYTDRQIYS